MTSNGGWCSRFLSAGIAAGLVAAVPVAAQEEGEAPQRPDLLLADFEGETYGDWQADGEALGPGPAQGTLPSQMSVSGYLGAGLVNTFHGGDGSTGTLTSPPFRVERRYLNFLIGGGKYPGDTCLDLLVDGAVVRTATGPNDQPGGSERLDWHSFDVAELEGQTAVLRIVDRRTGGWGHVNVDHIHQSDEKLQAGPARRELRIEQRYLHLPVEHGAPKRRVRYEVGGETVREFEIELAEGEPDFLVFSDVGQWRGEELAIAVDAMPPSSQALEAIAPADELPDSEGLYAEAHRPQFHFTSRRGWLNDPNGLVYFEGEYHLFYQHNPYGWSWGNMHWGHAVSPDLVHWTELSDALHPPQFGDWCFSGSALVDAGNRSGLGPLPGEDLLVAAWTSTGRGECVAFSTDRGRTFTEYPSNPVVSHRGRDPKVIWHEPTQRWVMAVYDELEGERSIAFHTSPDLQSWEFQSRIEGFYECPDLFELAVSSAGGAARGSEPEQSRWVLYAADGRYVLGDFDGSRFAPDGAKRQVWYGNFYAAQTFFGAPDGRRIQIGWGRGVELRSMPFNQQMTVPVDLTLRRRGEELALCAEPVRELSALARARHFFTCREVTDGEVPLSGPAGGLYDARVRIEIEDAASAGLAFGAFEVRYDAGAQQLSCGGVTAPLEPQGGAVHLRVLVDRASLEVFGNGGRVALSAFAAPGESREAVSVFAREGTARFDGLEVFELASAWTEH